VHLDQPLDERKAKAQTAPAAAEPGVGLKEGLEDARQHLPIDPRSGAR
jgi:hypothetical protein